MNTTDGATARATANNVLTPFSPSPTHLLVNDEDEMLKKVAPASFATALAIKV